MEHVFSLHCSPYYTCIMPLKGCFLGYNAQEIDIRDDIKIILKKDLSPPASEFTTAPQENRRGLH